MINETSRSKSGSRLAAIAALLAGLFAAAPQAARALAGGEGASFLDIPVGGRPAALGSAYSALASDSYATLWNPGGLAFVSRGEASLMHLSYLDQMSYETLGVALPVGQVHGIGGSLQYFRSGSINATDAAGNSIGTFSGDYLAASLGYGYNFGGRLGVGATGRFLSAQIAGVGASAFSTDLGALARLTPRLRLGVVAANLGSGMRFISESDPLPAQLRIGGALDVTKSLLVSIEGVRAFRSDDSFHAGMEWRPISLLALRAGYSTQGTRDLGGMSGLTLGTGLAYQGVSLDYAWVPMGDLGQTNYISLGVKFGPEKNSAERMGGGSMIVLP